MIIRKLFILYEPQYHHENSINLRLHRRNPTAVRYQCAQRCVTAVTLVGTVMLQRFRRHRCCTIVSLHRLHTNVAAIAVTVLSTCRPLLSQHN